MKKLCTLLLLTLFSWLFRFRALPPQCMPNRAILRHAAALQVFTDAERQAELPAAEPPSHAKWRTTA